MQLQTLILTFECVIVAATKIFFPVKSKYMNIYLFFLHLNKWTICFFPVFLEYIYFINLFCINLTRSLTGTPLLSWTTVNILTTAYVCLFVAASSSTTSPHFYHLSLFVVSLCVLNASQSFPQVSSPSLSLPSPISLWSPLLVISTCQTKGSRQTDGQMNTQICRGAKGMMEWWNKGVTLCDRSEPGRKRRSTKKRKIQTIRWKMKKEILEEDGF